MRRLLRKLRSLWPRSHCRIERHGRVCIAFDPNYPLHVRAYYRYCVELFRNGFVHADRPVNAIFGAQAAHFGNAARTLRIDLQLEHTLVRPGGRDSEGAATGTTPLADDSGCYLVRIANEAYLRSLDTCIEYSRPNLVHVRAAAGFAELAARTTLIAPLLYAPRFERDGRDIAAISLMFDERQPRRRHFLDAARRSALPLRNVRGMFDPDALRRLYDRVQILVNVHQTDHHHTFEELRVLPALLRGVIVVSEDVPLRDEIPYHRSVVWSRYDSIIDTVRHVLDNLDEYRARLFAAPLAGVLAGMARDNHASVAAAIRRMTATND